MTIQDAIKTVQEAPLEDRIQIMELLLQSLKSDLAHAKSAGKVQKPFKIYTFDLGSDVLPDREEMYISRGL